VSEVGRSQGEAGRCNLPGRVVSTMRRPQGDTYLQESTSRGQPPVQNGPAMLRSGGLKLELPMVGCLPLWPSVGFAGLADHSLQVALRDTVQIDRGGVLDHSLLALHNVAP
jgi:hypothetical protein